MPMAKPPAARIRPYLLLLHLTRDLEQLLPFMHGYRDKLPMFTHASRALPCTFHKLFTLFFDRFNSSCSVPRSSMLGSATLARYFEALYSVPACSVPPRITPQYLSVPPWSVPLPVPPCLASSLTIIWIKSSVKNPPWRRRLLN